MEYGHVLIWWVIFQAFAILGLPVAAALFPRFADRGAAFALPIALTVVTSLVFWLGHISFGYITIFVALAVLAAVAAVSTRRGVTSPWRAHVEATIVFTLGFTLVLAIRSVDPAVTPFAGEKFLDYGLLQSLLRANALPPEDMWFAGEPVQYYYGGHLITAILTTLTGTEPRFAYNLALAGFYGMLVTTAYGLAGAIAAEHGTARRPAAAFAAFFVGFASNLYTPLRYAARALPDGIGRALAGVLGVDPEKIHAEFSYWSASRVIENTINEFPLFAFINGDLHAHMMSMPFLLLAGALLYGYFRTPATERGRRLLLLAATVPVAGLLAVVNTWDFPTVAGLVFLSLTFARAHPLTLLPASMRGRFQTPAVDRWRETWVGREASRLAAAVIGTVVVGIVAAIWVAPFIFGTASSREVGFLPARSSFSELVLVHGAFLLVFALYLSPRARSLVVPERADRLAVLATLLLLLGWVGDLAAVILLGPFLLVAWLLLRDGADVGYETVLLVAGAGLVLLVEFVYVEELAAPARMNTVFKVYAQVWVFWGVGAGVALARFADVDGPSFGRRLRMFDNPQVASLLAVALITSLSFYGVFALNAHFEGAEEPTLNGMQYAETSHPHEAEAIAWLAQRNGQPHLLTAPGLDIYRWVNAPSTFTGLPTVAGWVHEVGYRNPDNYYSRVNDVETMYTGSWEDAEPLLAQYDVQFIYVGPEERDQYGERDFATHPAISVAYENEEVVIYEVDQSVLTQA